MIVENYVEMNRVAWNEVTPIHQKSRKDVWDSDLAIEITQPDFNCLEDEEMRMFSSIGLKGKSVAQLCCNNGRETISLKKLGALRAVGFDLSDEAIMEANSYNELSNAGCEFVRCSVYDIGDEYFGQFDIVYMSIGGMTWLKDSMELFSIISHLLKPEGKFVIYDMHPFTDMLSYKGEEGYDVQMPDKAVYSYFRKEPWVESSGLDYYGWKEYDANPCVSFPRKMSEIIMSAIKNGLDIEYFEEFKEDISNGFEEVERRGLVPLSYSLIAKKRRGLV